MIKTLFLLSALWGCSSDAPDQYIVEGTVVEVRPHDIVVDHKAIEDRDIDAIPSFQIEGRHVKTDGDDFLVALGIDHLDHFLIRQNNIHDAA